jgi:hypothetical protein
MKPLVPVMRTFEAEVIVLEVTGERKDVVV